jgi:hypothetical protein
MAGRIQEVAFNFTAANQFSEWIRHDYYQSPFCVSLGVFFDEALAATLSVQYALDDSSEGGTRPVAVSQSTTVITVTDYGKQVITGLNPSALATLGHGLAVGDWVSLFGTGLGIDGEYDVASVTDAHTYTLTSAVSQSGNAQAQVKSARVLLHDSLVGITARASGNYAYPVYMSRLFCTAFTSAGVGRLVAMQGGNLR